MSRWNHTICEKCWFNREPERLPRQLIRESGDLVVDQCCFCGTIKVTRIYVREDPESERLVCTPEWHREEE